MIRRLKYRQLLKISTSRRKQDLPEETIEKLIRLASNSSERIELEDKIAKRAGLDEGYVAIDVPSVKLLLSEPRMSQVDIRIIGDDGKTRWFKDHTPIAEALRKRQVSQEVVYVMTLPGYEKIVSRLADEHIFS
jgi:HD superfamily phosphohydrolase